MRSALLSLLLVVSACKSSGSSTSPLLRELKLISADLTEMQALVADDDPEIAATLAGLNGIVQSVTGTVGDGNPQSIREAVQIGLAATAAVLVEVEDMDEKDQTRVELAVFAVDAILRRVEAYTTEG